MRASLATLCGLLVVGAAPWVAPEAARAQVQDSVVDIYGDDPCPASNGQEIVVCRRHPRNEQYRIPQALRESEPAPQARGGNANALAAVNTTGGTGAQVQSCNAIGAGVSAGCLKKEADAWHAQKKADAAQAATIP